MWYVVFDENQRERRSHIAPGFSIYRYCKDVQSCGRVLELIWETTKIEKWSRLALDREKGWGRN